MPASYSSALGLNDGGRVILPLTVEAGVYPICVESDPLETIANAVRYGHRWSQHPVDVGLHDAVGSERTEGNYERFHFRQSLAD